MEILLIILPVILMFASQAWINGAYNKYKLIKSKNGASGYEAARKILDLNGLEKIKITKISGTLSDHYDPKKEVVSLSSDVYDGTSIASIAIAAHECGHVIQHKSKYIPIIIRSALVPVVNLTSKIGYIMLAIGLFSELLNLAYIGLILMCGSLLFQIVTLPVELDASRRAKKILLEQNIILNTEKNGVENMLNSAAFTYLASFFVTLMQIARILININRRRD